MKVSVIGQSMFASSVYQLLKENGHSVVAVFTIPDSNGREDPLALAASADNVPVYKYSRWRTKGLCPTKKSIFRLTSEIMFSGKIIPEIFENYKSLGVELNVLAYCSQFIPMEVITYPKHESICYHPSLLPKHRGASSINWTLISGDKQGSSSRYLNFQLMVLLVFRWILHILV